MAIHKPNIQKHIQSQPKRASSPNSNPLANKGSFADSPIFAMAQGLIENMPTKYKWAIGGAIYLIVSGAVANIYLIIKLITLAF